MNLLQRLPFRDARQRRIFALLTLLSLCVTALVALRMALKHNGPIDIDSPADLLWNKRLPFGFLLWNLFLSWVPYLLSLLLEYRRRRGTSITRLLPGLVLWLLFFPNAPYVVTDLIHLRPAQSGHPWLDIAMLFGAAATGLLLGLFSLYEVQRILSSRFSQAFTRFCLANLMLLSGLGIWIGRYQRWNSWDMLTRPHHLLQDLAATLSQRTELLRALEISLVLSGMLLIGYICIHTLDEVTSARNERGDIREERAGVISSKR